MTDSHTSRVPLPPGIEATMVSSDVIGRTELKQRFGFHKASSEGGGNKTLHEELREAFLELAEYLDEILPANREKEETLTYLENSCMWANKSVAKSEPLEK